MTREPLSGREREWAIRRGRSLKISPENLADMLNMPLDEVRKIWSRGPVTRHPETNEPEFDFGEP